MNKHFHDSRYYLTRAVEHATLGVDEMLEPYATRLRELLGREQESDSEPEPTRLEAVRAETAGLERKAGGQVRTAIGSARTTLSRTGSNESIDDQ